MTDTPTDPTPRERVARAYTDDPDARMRQRVAAMHDPSEDAEADRLAAIGETVPLSAVQTVALGYQRGQRDAAAALTTTATTTDEGARA